MTEVTPESVQSSQPAKRRRDRTRERLVSAASEVFAERGIAAATIDEITAAAGFTKGAFYSSFDSKEELFILVIERRYEDVLESTQEPANPSHMAAEPGHIDGPILGSLMQEIMSRVHDERTQQLLRSEATQLALRDDGLRKRYVEVRNKVRERLAKVLASGVNRIGRRLLVSDDQAIRLLLAVYEGLLTDLLLEDTPEKDLAGLLQEPLSAVLLGITAPSPTKAG